MLLRTRLFIVFLCLQFLPLQCLAYANTHSTDAGYSDAMQAAQILGIKAHVDRLLARKKESQNLDYQPEDLVLLKSLILRKILRAVLEVRQACNQIDLELAYTYDLMQREERKERFIFELFNLANFAQISTLYTLEAYVRLHKQFVMSAIFTTTSGSLNILISTLSRIYGHMARASNVAPPKALANILNGNPVDTSGMPPLVTGYLDSKRPGSSKTRREELFSMWKKNYHIDASKSENLCGIADKKKVSTRFLSNRTLLLWSLHTFVQDFDQELLSLLKTVNGPVSQNAASSSTSIKLVGYNANVVEVAHMLKIQPQINELIPLQQNNIDSKRRDELELLILEKTLEGALEVQVASDKVDDELNYNYHIILASLLNSRAKWLQWNYNLNFLQSGIMGVVAGRLYLSRFSYAGDRQFVISGGIGTGLTTLAILQMHGFWRKVDTGPNSLAEVLNLHPPDEYRFSPFVSTFLNNVPPGSSDGKTRRESLNDAWEKAKITTISLNDTKNRIGLANMPPHKYDTIKLVTNRNVLLHSLKEKLESFQGEVLDLLLATQSGRAI